MPGSHLSTTLEASVLRIALGIGLFLLLANVVFVLFPEAMHDTDAWSEPLRSIVEELDLDREANVATWYTSSLLLLNALAAWAFSLRERGVDPKAATASAILALGFLVLSADDVARGHERLEDLLGEWLEGFQPGVDWEDALGAVFALALALPLIGLVVRGYAGRLARRQWVALAWTLSGLAAAVLAETVYRLSGSPYPSTLFRIEVVFEEGGEIVALLAFLEFQRRLSAASARVDRSSA